MPPGDELDPLLSAYFKAQLPAPWPAFEPPAPPRTLLLSRPARRVVPVLSSRLVLAASVALVLLGFWLLPGGTRPVDGSLTLPAAGPGSASKPRLLEVTPARPKEAPPDGDLRPEEFDLLPPSR